MDQAKEQYVKALSFWTLSFQYLTLVQNAARETVAHGNAHVIVRDGKDGFLSEKESDEKWRWSDHRIAVPVLFNLYHGLELLVKGFILARAPERLEAHHGIQEWVEQFALLFPDETDLCDRLRKYTQPGGLPDLIGRFLSDNQIQFGQLYEVLRYPTNRGFSNTKRYIELKYKGEDGVAFFRDLVSDLDDVRYASLRLGRVLERQDARGNDENQLE